MCSKIRQILSNRGWSLYRLSKESGVSASIIYDFLVSGKIRKLGRDKLYRVCNSLEIPFQCLFDEKNNVEIVKDNQYNLISDKKFLRIYY